MEDNQPQPMGDDFLESLMARYGLTREEALQRYWQFLVKRPTTSKIFYLLKQRGEMYQREIAEALAITSTAIKHAMTPLTRRQIIEIERRGHHVYYRLQPNVLAEYEQWLASQQPDEPEP